MVTYNKVFIWALQKKYTELESSFALSVVLAYASFREPV